MSLKSRFFTIFTAAAATAALATFTLAQESTKTPAPEKKAEKRMKGEGMKMGGKGHFGKRGGMMGMWAGRMGGFRGIELTDAQKEQIKSIREANKPTGAHRDELKTIAEARRAGTITDAQKERVKAIRQEMMAHRQNVRAQILAVLTPEQKAQIEQRRTQMQQRRQEFRQKRQQGKPAVTANDTF
jgi:periplasmic protein CpxP/Spy